MTAKTTEKQRALSPPAGTTNVPNYYWNTLKRSIAELERTNELEEHEWRASRLTIQHRIEELAQYIKSIETLQK